MFLLIVILFYLISFFTVVGSHFLVSILTSYIMGVSVSSISKWGELGKTEFKMSAR